MGPGVQQQLQGTGQDMEQDTSVWQGEALGEGPLVPSRHVTKTQLTWAAEEPELWNLKLPSGL